LNYTRVILICYLQQNCLDESSEWR